MIVSNILDKLFLNVKLDDIDKSLTLIGGSLPGDRDQHPPSEGANDRPSQAGDEIDIKELNYKVGTEVSSVTCNLNYLEDHRKAEYDYVTGADGKQRRARRR